MEEFGGGDPRVVTALHTITLTILLSVVLHGITGRPLAARYVRRRDDGPAAPPMGCHRPGRPDGAPAKANGIGRPCRRRLYVSGLDPALAAR